MNFFLQIDYEFLRWIQANRIVFLDPLFYWISSYTFIDIRFYWSILY